MQTNMVAVPRCIQSALRAVQRGLQGVSNHLSVSLLVGALAVGVAGDARAYVIGGPNCAIAPGSFQWCWGGTELAPLRAALANPAYFGPAGTVQTSVTTVDLPAVNAATLAGVDAFVAPWWADSDASAAAVAAVVSFFLGGGDLLLWADDSAHDPVGAALGLPTSPSTGSVSNGGAPLFDGPFGTAANVTQNFAVGRLLAADVAAQGGTVAATNVQGQITAAIWSEGQYAPGAGRLVLIADVDMSSLAGGATYFPLNDDGTFTLNAVAFLLVPEPGTVALLGLGLLIVTARLRRAG